MVSSDIHLRLAAINVIMCHGELWIEHKKYMADRRRPGATATEL